MSGLRASLFSLSPLVATGILAMGCTSNGGGAPSADASDEADAESSPADATRASEEAEAEAPAAQLRVAALSPDLPAFDLCFARHGTGAYQGPLFAQLAGDGGTPEDAAPPGLSYPQVSAYVPFDPGMYDVRIVAAGAASCATALAIARSVDAGTDPGDDADTAGDADASADAATIGFLPDTTDLPVFATGAPTTLLVVGDVAPAGADEPLRLATIQDDTAPQGAVSLRVVDAQPNAPALDFGFGSFAGGWTPLFTNVAFGTAGSKAAPSQGSADANGYLSVAPFSSQTLSARLSVDPTGDAAIAKSASLSEVGSVATVVAIGGKTGDTAHAPALLLCTDNAPSGGALADCSALP